MIAKCGRIVVPHWAHLVDEGCHAYGPETAWHLDWKARMHDAGAEVEVIRRRGDQTHIADVVLPSGRVLELAGTYHPADVIEARERFYGPTMRWLYNAEGFVDRIEFLTRDPDDKVFRFKQPPQSMVGHRRWPVFWDVGDESVYAIERLWRWNDRTYGALADEGGQDEFIESAVRA